jgi:hypothetical protein
MRECGLNQTGLDKAEWPKLGLHFDGIQYVSFNCCLFVHVDNYTIIIPTKCTRFLLLKAQDITICTFLSSIFAPTCFNPRDM